MRFIHVPAGRAMVAGLLLTLAIAGCGDLGTSPPETGVAAIEFVTYPGEVESGNVALFTLLGHSPSPCHEVTGATATLSDDRIQLAARWRRTDDDGACTAAIEPFESTASLRVPAGWDSLKVTVADSVWDRIPVLVDAPGFKKAAGELQNVAEVGGAPGCYRGFTAAGSRSVLLEAEEEAAHATVVGRLEDRVPEACADADLENVLGTLEPEQIRTTATMGG